MMSIDRHSRSIETLSKIQEVINSVHEELVTRIRKEENDRLQQYKKELLTKKIDFQKINLGRSENTITQNIMSCKKVLQKQCAVSLEKSMKASKMHEELKHKLNSLQSEQREMELEAKYLEKRIAKALKKQNGLKQAKEQILQQYKGENQKSHVRNLSRDTQLSQPFGNLDLNTLMGPRNSTTEGKPARRQNKNKNAENRLKLRIDCIKQYINSLIFVKTDLENIFEPYIDKTYDKLSEKQKLELGEQILSKPWVKRQLYQLLFPQ